MSSSVFPAAAGKALAMCIMLIAPSLAYPCPQGDSRDSSTVIPPRPRRIYTTVRLDTEKPNIDGVLDDACWKSGEWAGDFTQWVPREGARPSQPTQVKILYDDRNIYVAFRAIDREPGKISMKAGRRDEFAGDVVGVSFDSYHDHRTGFEFDVTAAGQKTDLVLTNPSNPDFNCNAVWYVKTGLEDSAWTAEFEIPLSQLRYSSEIEQVWGMHCWRWIDRLQEESDWEPQSSEGPGILYLFGELRGIRDLPASRRIEIMPYSVGKLKTFRKEDGNPFADKGRTWLGNAGVDAKLGLSSNFTADLTLNPDFGQVESDPSVMNLTAFETFYEEKRPFFLEGKNIFSFDFDNTSIFYSRRIGHAPSYSPELKSGEYMSSPDNTTILGALKISGKTSGGLSIGVLQALTDREQAQVEGGGSRREVTVEPLTSFFLGRVQQDYAEGNTVVGGILTATNRFIRDSRLDFLNREAYTGGLDLLHQWSDKEFFVDAKVAGSLIKGNTEALGVLQNSPARYYGRPDVSYVGFDSTRTQLSGYGGRVRVGKGSKGLWRYSSELNWRSPGLDFNDLGYMQTTDILKIGNSVSYFVNQPVYIFRTYSIGLSQINTWDFGMRHLSSGGSLNLYFEFLNNWAVSSSLTYTSEALDPRILRGGPAMRVPAVWSLNSYARTDPSERVYADCSTTFSASGNRSYRGFSIQPGLSAMPLTTLKFSAGFSYSSNIDNLQYVDAKTAGNETRYILARIDQQTLGVTFRIDYNLTPEFSIQYYGSPFASVGRYSLFKAITNPTAADYGGRFQPLGPVLLSDSYEVPEVPGSSPGYSFGNPDFDFGQFRSILVFRWEYRPGSQVYLVWSHERTQYVQPGISSVGQAMTGLGDVPPQNIFLVKFNYWFSI